MLQKTLLFAATLTTCWAKSPMLTQDKIPTDLQMLDRSLISVPGATLDEYTSPTLPCNTYPTLPCEGQGYFSLPSDCNKFYRCIDVSNNHDYMQLVFKCHAGTIFSSEHKSCIPGTCSNELAPAVASAAASIRIAAEDDEFLVPSIGHQDIHSRSTSRQYGISECNSSGRFADPNNCGNFYDCVPSYNGTFKAHQRSCSGHAFHPTLKACVAPREVDGCFPDSSRGLTVVAPNLTHLCIDDQNAFLCADCKTLVLCIGGVSHSQSCDYGEVCSMNMENIFGGAVCFPGNPVECTCNKAESFQKDIYDSSKFLSCDIDGAEPTMHSCKYGLEFDEERRTCGNGTEPTCAASGAFAVKDDCTRYFIFIFTTEGWVHKELACRKYTMFNEQTGNCEDPCDWFTGQFTCETQGRFANRADCTKYYECVADPLKSNKLSWVEYKCPDGYEWYQMDGMGDGYCMFRKFIQDKCVPEKPINCNVPEEWCITDLCNPNCTFGVCTGPNICSCVSGWEGDICDIPVCSQSCNSGVCTSPDMCTCDSGWTGNLCDIPMCSPNCTNGECRTPNKCACEEGWGGDLCQIQCLEADGYFTSDGSNECFMVFEDRTRTWLEAQSKCTSEGLQLAEPMDAVAVNLRKDLLSTYGANGDMWLNARGNGSVIMWQSDNEVIPITSSLWSPGTSSRVGISYCVLVEVHTANMNQHTPYYPDDCTSQRFTLCEVNE